MRLLLDTHAIIWAFEEPARLPSPVREALLDNDIEVFISAASMMEMSIKHRIGKLPQVAALLSDYEALLAEATMHHLDVTLAHAHLAGSLDIPHKNPFDRLLIAQALTDNLILVSNERLFDGFGVKRLWD